MWETWVRFLGWEDPLEKGMATHSSILAWRISWTEEPGRLESVGSQRVQHNWEAFTCDYEFSVESTFSLHSFLRLQPIINLSIIFLRRGDFFFVCFICFVLCLFVCSSPVQCEWSLLIVQVLVCVEGVFPLTHLQVDPWFFTMNLSELGFESAPFTRGL